MGEREASPVYADPSAGLFRCHKCSWTAEVNTENHFCLSYLNGRVDDLQSQVEELEKKREMEENKVWYIREYKAQKEYADRIQADVDELIEVDEILFENVSSDNLSTKELTAILSRRDDIINRIQGNKDGGKE